MQQSSSIECCDLEQRLGAFNVISFSDCLLWIIIEMIKVVSISVDNEILFLSV